MKTFDYAFETGESRAIRLYTKDKINQEKKL
jgi:hypothetical protein